MLRGNLFADPPDATMEERIEELTGFVGDKVRVERIVSEGQATPEGYWYNQAWGEWVAVLRGGAEIAFDAPPRRERLSPGDWLFIPAGRRHRVAFTEKGTFWLAVHGGGPDGL